ncbi:MAG: autotransporter-associated beta strand protein, partial [Kiritimatiellia bacterium]
NSKHYVRPTPRERHLNVKKKLTSMLMLSVLVLPGRSIAQSGTWTTNAAGSWTNTTNWSAGTIADGSGQTADFSTIDITDDRTVSIDSFRTIGHLTFGDTDTDSAAGWILDRTTTNTLTLSGGTITVTALGVGKEVDLKVPLAGTSDITVKGGGALRFSATNTISGHMNIGTTDDGNTVTFDMTGHIVPSPGRDLRVGNNFSHNSLTVGPGCVANWRAGATLGSGAGGNSNTLIVTGSGAQVIVDNNGGSQFNVGVSGAVGNRVEIRAGGDIRPQKFVIGRSGGSDNSVLITGPGSVARAGAGNQGRVHVGTGTGSSKNSITIENGGHLLCETGDHNKSGGSIGDRDGANDNYILVETNGTFSFIRNVADGRPFVIGAYNGVDGDNGQEFPVDSTANGNHLDIAGGGSFVTLNASVYVMGTNSAINLGDGEGIGHASVHRTPAIWRDVAYTAGINLYKTDARLNFNSGRLTALVDGEMVSGPGVVSNAGPAYVSTEFPSSSIDSVVTGSGDLIKEGSGVLALSATNTHSGNVIVSEGTLRLTQDRSLSALASLHIATGTMVDLAFTGKDIIKNLYIDGNEMPNGRYGQLRLPMALSGTGFLDVTGGEDPAGFVYIIR